MVKLSLCIATHNEESNLPGCLDSAKALADEIIIVDGSSTDKTVEIAKKYGARVIVTDNPSMFHINKQKALDAAKGEWILQLDADERVSLELAVEIKKVINMNLEELETHQEHLSERKLFLKHQLLTYPQRPFQIGKYTAFYIPRLNYFLGKFLRHGGVYPDGAIRLVKKGKAHFPCKDIHEVMEVDGKVGWLQNPLLHYDSPTFSRYLERNSRYINLLAEELRIRHSRGGGNPVDIQLFFDYMFFKPLSWFLTTTFRHKGILDGWQGMVFSFFSALRFPRSYVKYISNV